jgi:hypothetical protein
LQKKKKKKKKKKQQQQQPLLFPQSLNWSLLQISHNPIYHNFTPSMAHTPAVAPCCQRSPCCFLGASNEGFQAFWISCTAAAGVCALVSPQKDGRTDAQDKNSTVMDLHNKQPCTYEFLQNQQHRILLENKLMGSVRNFCKSQAYCTVTATTKNPRF